MTSFEQLGCGHRHAPVVFAGEKGLGNQISYIAARPATIGALLDVASRVKSGPVEVTSLVRHSKYQGALRATNKNATTSVPMHTMGLAFDIALVNTPPHTVYEIRDVLRKMRDAGDILFIGERQQLVFHVGPHPSRLGHFDDVYARALGAVAPAEGTPIVAHGDLSVEVSPSPSMVAAAPAVRSVHARDGFGSEFFSLVAAVLGIAAGVRRMPALDSGGVRL